MANKLQIRRGTKTALDLITLAAGELGWATDTKGLYIGDGTNNKLYAAAGASYVKVSDVKTVNTPGGAFTSGAWQTRTLNTKDSDPDSICTLSSNQIVLSAGTYECRISAPAYFVNGHKVKLRNVTGSTDILLGSTEFSTASAANSSTRSLIVGRFAVAASQSLEVQHRCYTTKTANGLGEPANVVASEVYTIAEFWKIYEGGAQAGSGFSSRARGYRATAQTIPQTTWTKVQLNYESFDELGEFDSTTNYRFVASQAGYYLVFGQVSSAYVVADAVRYITRIYKNGTFEISSDKSMGSAQYTAQGVSGIVYLAATDYLELWFYHTDAANDIVNTSGDTFMTVHRIS